MNQKFKFKFAFKFKFEFTFTFMFKGLLRRLSVLNNNRINKEHEKNHRKIIKNIPKIEYAPLYGNGVGQKTQIGDQTEEPQGRPSGQNIDYRRMSCQDKEQTDNHRYDKTDYLASRK